LQKKYDLHLHPFNYQRSLAQQTALALVAEFYLTSIPIIEL